MEINDKARIHWACRRGMRELDILLMPFFQYEYDALDPQQKQLFVRLLEKEDPDLFNWLMGNGVPQDPGLAQIIRLIQTRNRQRGPVVL